MRYNKYNDNHIRYWMKDSEKEKLADSLTSYLTRVSDDWSIEDSRKAIGLFEKWAFPLIDQEKLCRYAGFDDELVFSFHVSRDVHSDELFDLLQEYHPEKWLHIRDTMMSNPTVQLTYEDRYINTPLGCLLLAQFIRRVRDLYQLNFRDISISLSKKDFRVIFDDDDLKLDHRFSFAENRDKFLRQCMSEIVGCKYHYETKNVGHTRSLCIFNPHYCLSILPDGGLAHGWGIENGMHNNLTTKSLLQHLDTNIHCFNREAHRNHRLGIQYVVKFKLLDGQASHF